MTKIKFTEEGHSYEKPNIKYTSVTTLISKYKNGFDSNHWSSYKAAQKIMSNEKFTRIRGGRDASDPHVVRDLIREFGGSSLEDFNRVKTEFIDKWNETRDIAATRGTIYHEFKEKQSYEKGNTINPFTGKVCKTFRKERTPGFNYGLKEDLFELEDGFYPELVIWNDTYKIAGQADKVYIETLDKRYVDIDDFKTNKKIDKRSFWKRSGYEMMKPPLGHIMDCNFYHYELQISMYAWMLQQFGFTPRNLAFDHLTTHYPLKYRKWEIQKMLTTL